MCGNMIDIQSPIAEIRRRKKKKEGRRKIEITAAKYNGLSVTMGGHNNNLQDIREFCRKSRR